MNVPEYKNKPYFIVASVEMGNTTTKCILTGVNLETGLSYVIHKTVSMSRDIRPPKPGETIFGATLDGTELTREAVTELVRDTLLQCHKDARLDVLKDLDFVVRSTGVVAEMERSGRPHAAEDDFPGRFGHRNNRLMRTLSGRMMMSRTLRYSRPRTMKKP